MTAHCPPANCYGNLLEETVSASDGYSKTAEHSYWNDATNWIIGKRTRTETTSAGVTRTMEYEYDATTGLLDTEITEPDTQQLRLETDYTYNGMGNVTDIVVSSPATGIAGIQTRQRSFDYDSRGRFPVTVTNELGHEEDRLFDSWFGTVFETTDPNGLTENTYHNDIGLKYKEVAKDGTVLYYGWATCGTGCPQNAFYYRTLSPVNASETALNGRVRTIFYDKYNRVIREEYDGYDGNGTPATIVEATEYDSLGRVAQKSRPFEDGSSPIHWTIYSYDVLDRVISETRPDGSHTDYSYNGLVTTQHTYQSTSVYQETVTTTDSQGRKTQIVDDNGQIADYSYDGFDNLLSVSLDPGHDTLMQYDVRGRKIQHDDPDKGQWSYVYNVVDELVQQTDAKSQTSTLSYDKLNRLVSRVEPDLTSNWYYDALKGGGSCPKGIGKLCEEETNGGYSRVYEYDSLSRRSNIETTLNTNVYTASVTYDVDGRVDSITYPSGLEINNVYTQRGFHQKITNATGTHTYWESTGVDAEDHVVEALLGNGLTTERSYDDETGRLLSQTTSDFLTDVQALSYQYDWMGNVTSRDDTLQSITESLSYDKLNRVTNTSGSGVPAIGYSYGSTGNLLSKSDVGSYSYSGTAVRPHAVTQVTGSINTSFTYDNNGNMLTGKGRTLTWTSYDQPATITQGGQTVSFSYDTGHQRFKRVEGTTTTYYLNPASGEGLFFEQTVTAGQTLDRHYLSVSGRVVAVVDKQGQSEDTYYWHLDNLGSLNVVTDEYGLVVQHCHYSAFGQRDCDSATPLFDRGYTGHEHMPAWGLVNMNGRLFDPELSRFLSADIVIPETYNTQSYNHYSYVFNSPFRYTDPSGFFSDPLEAAAMQMVFGATQISGVSEISMMGLALVSPGTMDSMRALADVGVDFGVGAGGGLGVNGIEGDNSDDESRFLTVQEIDASKKLYSDLDYSIVKVYFRKYIFLQDENIMMAPDGNIYDPRGAECSDYTICQRYITDARGNSMLVDTHGTFIHEMGHIAQHQHGVNVFWRGLGQQLLFRMTFGIYDPYFVRLGSPPPITDIEGYAEYNRNNYCSSTGECRGWN